MGKKDNKSEKPQKSGFVKFCSFWGLTLAAILFITSVILNLINSESLAKVVDALDLIAKVLLLIAVGVPAFGYVIKKGIVWKIIFFAALVVYALAMVFNVIIG